MIPTTTLKCDSFKDVFNASLQHKRLFLILLLLLVYTTTGRTVKNSNFDYFVFSQRWLPTSCIEYVEHNHSHHCDLPANFEFWAIHGLWPTQNNHMGPFFCNKSAPFDVNKLKPIQSALTVFWPNIEGGKSVSSLWQHEWEKHGTCAAQLESLDSEFKYFNVTLNLYKTYNIENVFEKKLINPSMSNGISVSDLFQILKGEFGKLPQINCIYEVKSKKSYLSEIRLCYTKSLELRDCGNMVGSKFSADLTNCPLDKKVVFPDRVAPQINSEILLDSSVDRNYYYSTLLDLLHILKFLMWASI